MRILVKMAGIFCIMAASAAAGAELERRCRKRWLILREMYETLLFLEKEMTYHRSPIREAFLCASKRCRTELGAALEQTAEQIGQRSGAPFARMWEEALGARLPRGLLSPEDMELFRETSAALCSADVVTQKMLLEKYTDRFRAASEREAEVCREKGGLYRRLAAAAGILLVILLL